MDGSRKRHEQLKHDLDQGYARFEIHGPLHLTKGQPTQVHVGFRRRLDLEASAEELLAPLGGFEEAILRYAAYDPMLVDSSRPRHVPVEMDFASGALASGRNIFLFAPQVFHPELRPEDAEDVAGLEFIDVWREGGEQIVLPLVERVFDPATRRRIELVYGRFMDEAAHLASVFHEVGHRVGPYAVSPHPDPRWALESHPSDCLGELATDGLMVALLGRELPLLSQFVTLQRLFWFGRHGSLEEPERGSLNSDNDAWLSAFLWQRLRERGLLRPTRRGWHLDLASGGLERCYAEIVEEIDVLAWYLLPKPGPTQRGIIRRWMRRCVPHDEGGFRFPEELAEVYALGRDLPECPRLQVPAAPALASK